MPMFFFVLFFVSPFEPDFAPTGDYRMQSAPVAENTPARNKAHKTEYAMADDTKGFGIGVSLAPMASPAPSWLKNSAVGATLGPAEATGAGTTLVYLFAYDSSDIPETPELSAIAKQAARNGRTYVASDTKCKAEYYGGAILYISRSLVHIGSCCRYGVVGLVVSLQHVADTDRHLSAFISGVRAKLPGA